MHLLRRGWPAETLDQAACKGAGPALRVEGYSQSALIAMKEEGDSTAHLSSLAVDRDDVLLVRTEVERHLLGREVQQRQRRRVVVRERIPRDATVERGLDGV